MSHLAPNPILANSRRVGDYFGDIDLPRYAALSVGTVGHPQSGERFAFPSPHVQRTSRSAEEMRLEALQRIAGHLGADHRDVFEFIVNRRLARQPASQVAPKPMAWLKNVNNRDAPPSIFAVSKTMNSLFRQLEADKDNKFVNIDRALAEINPEEANPYHAVAVMRALVPFRERLTSWSKVEAAMRDVFSRRFAKSEELRIDVLMHGLSADE
jgi:hypothetical protein